MSTHILTWSGGPDSTYQLRKLLEETDEPVVALVILGDNLGSAAREAIRAATRRIGRMLQQIRAFEIVEVAMGSEPPSGETRCQLFATMMIASQREDPIAYWCCNASDYDPEHGNWILGREDFLEWCEKMMAHACPLRWVGGDVTKAEIREALGPIWHETTSCEALDRTPEKPCGKCKKCAERRAALKAAAGKILGRA